MLEFYNGFQKSPQANNPFGEESSVGYYPCKLLGVFPLSDVDEEIVKEMDTLIEQDDRGEENEKAKSYILKNLRKEKLETL